MNDFIYFSYFVKKIIRNFINVKKEGLVANGTNIPSIQTRASIIHTWNFSGLRAIINKEFAT